MNKILKIKKILALFTFGFFLLISGNCIAGLDTENSGNLNKDKAVQSITKDVPAQSQSLINVNTADISQLAKLPGIGNSIAERIVKHRNEVGLFKTKEELLSVKGIGKKKYDKLSEMVTVQ